MPRCSGRVSAARTCDKIGNVSDSDTASIAAQMEAVQAAHGDGPVQMINLLKFRDRAAYPADYDGEASADCSGAEAYQRFISAVGDGIRQRGGRIVLAMTVDGVWRGDAEQNDWDRVGIVEYPSMSVLRELRADPDAAAAQVHAEAAVERWVILATTAVFDASVEG